MRMIRTSLMIFFLIVLLLALSINNLLLTIAISLDFEVVEPTTKLLAENLIKEKFGAKKILEENLDSTRIYCEENPEHLKELELYGIYLSCDNLELDIDKIIEKSLSDFTREIYYRDYDCDFWDCMDKTGEPFVLISLKAQDYWYSKFYTMLIVTLSIIAILFILFKKTSNFSIAIGTIFILSSLIFLKIESIIKKIIEGFSDSSELITRSSEIIMQGIILLFSETYQVYLTVILIGASLITLGILVKSFGLGMKLESWLEKIGKSSESKE